MPTAGRSKVETEWAFNADLILAIDTTTAGVVSQVAVDVTSAIQQAAPDDALQIAWAVSGLDRYDSPLVTGTALVNTQEYFADAVA